MIENIHWFGHDTFRIAGEKVVYTDPFRVRERDAADVILVTHEHYDHCSIDDIRKLEGDQTVIVAPAECLKNFSGNAMTVKPGDRINAGGIDIEVVPAYNINKPYHTKDKGWVGYIFTVNGRRIYLSGDTDYIPEMKTFRVDVALLPVSGIYVMTADEAAMAAVDVQARIAIPMHYGSIVGSKSDALRFAELLKGKVEAMVLPEGYE